MKRFMERSAEYLLSPGCVALLYILINIEQKEQDEYQGTTMDMAQKLCELRGTLCTLCSVWLN